jgi:hypothetical protein
MGPLEFLLSANFSLVNVEFARLILLFVLAEEIAKSNRVLRQMILEESLKVNVIRLLFLY